MEDSLEIFGGTPLRGDVTVGGAKNAALPIMIATLLTKERCSIGNVPKLLDVDLLSQLLVQSGGVVRSLPGANESLSRPKRQSRLGFEQHESGNSTFGHSDIGHTASTATLEIAIPELRSYEASYSLVKSLRASFWILAPLLARGGAARVAMPGGDVIGARPVDIHLQALTEMGAEISVRNGVVVASAPHGLHEANIVFRFPSVGATHQILMAASLTPGTTVIRNAAKEPEVVALADVLQKMGADVDGAGTSEIVIRGRSELGGFSADVIGDRIEAASYVLSCIAAKGDIRIFGFDPSHFGEFTSMLEELGARLEVLEGSGLRVEMRGRPCPIHVTTGPYPHFATDIQAPLLAALTLADGESTVKETVYEGRFGHVSELSRMGAKLSLSGQTATVQGVPKLLGATVEARDIRAGAAMVVAGLAASGRTVIEECQHLRRGYERIESKLRGLGAHVVSSADEQEELSLVGC